ncbi:MAG: phospholipid-binding protein [Leptolyngbya sp. SIO4C5]|uniref:phospholipid-binding protein n=1 Tax=Sphaerothrix gracilis TaxID=3151835 RepID=UPI0013C0ABE1|nr:phospholipid-binding protein [Leptolyngbya sp. SIO4C5]
MGWFSRLFGKEEKAAQQAAIAQKVKQPDKDSVVNTRTAQTQDIPLERLGPDGKYDQSGLAKRVAVAFDQDPELDDIETVYVAQLSSQVVLKGKAPSQAIVDKLAAVAGRVKGATEVDTSGLTVG